jgi:hypothetical protein
VVEHLLSKHEALSSNTNTEKKKKILFQVTDADFELANFLKFLQKSTQ